jgi:hypothetical protein
MLILLDTRVRRAHPPVACTIYISGGNARTREPALARSHRTEQTASGARVAVTVVHERPLAWVCRAGPLQSKKNLGCSLRLRVAALRAWHSHRSSKYQYTLWLSVAASKFRSRSG